MMQSGVEIRSESLLSVCSMLSECDYLGILKMMLPFFKGRQFGEQACKTCVWSLGSQRAKKLSLLLKAGALADGMLHGMNYVEFLVTRAKDGDLKVMQELVAFKK